MCIILSNSKRGQTSMLISYTMKEALSCGASMGRENQSLYTEQKMKVNTYSIQ